MPGSFCVLMREALDGEQRRLAKQAQGALQEAPQEVPAEAEGDLYTNLWYSYRDESGRVVGM